MTNNIVYTDFADRASVGLERTFRLLQEIVLIIPSYSFVFGLLHVLNCCTAKPPPPEATLSILLNVRQRLDLARRFFRVFRFLGSFHAGHKLYLSISPSKPTNGKRKPSWVQAGEWIDVLGCTFNGMYLLLETTTIIDALQVEGLRLWAPQWQRMITIEAQRFWLFALTCGLFSGLLKMLKVLAYNPVPATRDGFTHGKMEGNGATTTNEEVAAKTDLMAEFGKEKQLKDVQHILKIRERRSVLWTQEVRRKLHWLGRNIVANALDIVLPSVVVGWLDVGPGIVGLVMFSTTVLTGMDAWERCGTEMSERD